MQSWVWRGQFRVYIVYAGEVFSRWDIELTDTAMPNMSFEQEYYNERAHIAIRVYVYSRIWRRLQQCRRKFGVCFVHHWHLRAWVYKYRMSVLWVRRHYRPG